MWRIFWLLCCCSLGADAAQVFEKQGNVFFQPDTGAARQLTRLGQDSQPALSPDGQRIVFVRKRARSNPLIADEQSSDLWLMDANGEQAHVLVAAHPDAEMEKSLTEFNNPLFSLDGSAVYFSCAAWATSNSIHRVTWSQGQPVFITDGNSLSLVPRGKYAGYLLVFKHKYRKAGGADDAYWLVTPQGKDVRRIGDEEKHVQKFLRRYAPR